MRLVLITGTSGAGKTVALHSFEDAGYFTADNLPPALLENLVSFCNEAGYSRAAVVTDTRSGPSLASLPLVIRRLTEQGTHVETLFLDASDTVLVQRYKETRRPHPMMEGPTGAARQGGIVDAVAAEREALEPVREACDRIIDSGQLSAAQLRDILHATYAVDSRPSMLVTIVSFGFKHGLPIDADLVFDVRFLSNPHYVPALRDLDGRDPRVAAYVHKDPRTAQFQHRMEDLVSFSLPQYESEGKAYLNIAIGCTGGKHRSVVLAEALSAHLQQTGYHVALLHRDLPSERRGAGMAHYPAGPRPAEEGAL